MKMIKNLFLFIFISLFISGFGYSVFAQKDKNPIFVGDLDGNGKAERIIQIKFQKPTKLLSRKDRSKYEIRNGHYIRYVLYRNGQEKGMTIFEYLIGDDEYVTWKYEIEKAVDLNNDGWKDLIFYAGDDTTSETVFLIQKPDYFKAVYPGEISIDVDFWLVLDDSNNFIRKFTSSKAPYLIAKWNPQNEIFEGVRGKWINQNCDWYDTSDSKNKILIPLTKNDLVLILDGEENSRNGWQQVETGWGKGWVETKFLSNLSPTKKFPDN